jgi:hypothetical protein
LIACNLGCNPRHENKILVPILFLIGGFHFDHLYKWHVTLCTITPFMNKWTFTFCKYDCHSFTLCLPYTKLTSYLLDICKYLMMQSSIWQMVRTRTFEDSILDVPEGSIGRGHGQVPRGGAPPPPHVSLELATQNELMRRLVENNERHGAERQQPRHQERDSSYSDFCNSPACLCRCDRPHRGGQLAPHH